MFLRWAVFIPLQKPLPSEQHCQRTFSVHCFPQLFGSDRPQLSGVWRERKKEYLEMERKKEVRGERQLERRREGDWREHWKGVDGSFKQDIEQERRHRFSWREDEMEVKVEGWVGEKQNELTVPSQGKALVLFVWRLDCYLLGSRRLSSSLPLLVSSNEEGLRDGRKGRNVEAKWRVRKWSKVESKVDGRKKQKGIEQELNRVREPGLSIDGQRHECMVVPHLVLLLMTCYRLRVW